MAREERSRSPLLLWVLHRRGGGSIKGEEIHKEMADKIANIANIANMCSFPGWNSVWCLLRGAGEGEEDMCGQIIDSCPI